MADPKLERARDAPVIRQLFSSSPRDPRYHMLQYISAKFQQQMQPQVNEARAALFLNRFSRTLTIMYATNGLADLLGITNDQLLGKSFYYCIQENCLREGVKCLESAKANDSIAYLRFWFRDPRQDDPPIDPDERMSDAQSSGDDDDGGVHLSELMDQDGSEQAVTTGSSNSIRSSVEREARNNSDMNLNSRSLSGNSTDIASDRIFDQPEGQQSRTSSVTTPDEPRAAGETWLPDPTQIELEAVVSCTSDGLVVILRKARPFIPQVAAPAAQQTHHPYRNGLFASPWADNPIIPDFSHRSGPLPHNIQPSRFPINPTAQQVETAIEQGPATESFMNSIREVAVFAWALTGINGSLAQYGRGTPSGESQPPRLQIWNPNSSNGPEQPRYNGESQINGQHNGEPSSHTRPNEQRNVVRFTGQKYSFTTGLPEDGYFGAFNGGSSNRAQAVNSASNASMNMNRQMDGLSRSEYQPQHPNGHPHAYSFNDSSSYANGLHGANGAHGQPPLQPQQQQPSRGNKNGQHEPPNYWNPTR